MRVKDVMTRNPVYISPEASVVEAKNLMIKQNIGKLPVLDGEKNLVGIITKNDLTKAAPSEATTLDMYEIGYLLSKLKVEKIMQKKVITVSETEVVEEAAKTMVDNKIGCLPVIKDSLLVGIVTDTDLFKTLINLFGTREKGVRATFLTKDVPGELAKLSEAIHALGANVISIITWSGDDVAHKSVTVKASGITQEQMKEISEKTGFELRNISEI